MFVVKTVWNLFLQYLGESCGAGERLLGVHSNTILKTSYNPHCQSCKQDYRLPQCRLRNHFVLKCDFVYACAIYTRKDGRLIFRWHRLHPKNIAIKKALEVLVKSVLIVCIIPIQVSVSSTMTLRYKISTLDKLLFNTMKKDRPYITPQFYRGKNSD